MEIERLINDTANFIVFSMWYTDTENGYLFIYFLETNQGREMDDCDDAKRTKNDLDNEINDCNRDIDGNLFCYLGH